MYTFLESQFLFKSSMISTIFQKEVMGWGIDQDISHLDYPHLVLGKNDTKIENPEKLFSYIVCNQVSTYYQ